MAADIDVMSFGIDTLADVRANDIVSDGGGSSFELHLPDTQLHVRLSIPGRHNVLNACAAAATATSLGVAPEQIQAAFESVKPVAGRLQSRRGLSGSTLYDDSYNANPLSVAAAAEFLAGLKGQSWLVLGDMGELGDSAAILHREVGAAAKAAGVHRLFATGELSRNTTEAFGENASWFESVDMLIDALRVSVTSDVNLLVKGSRFMRMERVVMALASTDAASGED
jgi:UDP-N-acetylmuramoyl-tripeptide--D-alanyl-D-alanine ligase